MIIIPSRESAYEVSQELGSMTITQNSTATALLGTLQKLLPPPSIPTTIDLLPTVGYKLVSNFIDDGSDVVRVHQVAAREPGVSARAFVESQRAARADPDLDVAGEIIA